MFRVLLLVLFLALVVVLPSVIWSDQIEMSLSADRSEEWFRDFGGWTWAVGIGLMIGDVFLPIPGSVVMAAMGMVYGPFIGGLVAAAGSILAGILGYGLCRFLGTDLATKLTGERGMRQAEGLFERWGGWLVVASRWLPVLPETVAFLAGLTRMPFPKFFLALVCGSTPLGFAYATAGHLGGGNPTVTLLTVMLVPLVLWFVFQKLFFAEI